MQLESVHPAAGRPQTLDEGLHRCGVDLLVAGLPRCAGVQQGFDLPGQPAQGQPQSGRLVNLAGLVAGVVAHGRQLRVIGASVSRPAEEVAARVLFLARQVAERRGEELPTDTDVQVVDARGPGHGIAMPAGNLAAATALRTAGLVLDPVYTAKALAVLPSVVGGGPALFWHTGGLLDAVAGLLKAQT